MIHDAFIILRKELRNILKDKRTLVATLVIPLLLIPLLFVGMDFVESRQQETARAHYWLARIGGAQEDWDAMEIHAQRATVLAPKECRYYQLFAQALRKMGKVPQAKSAEHRFRQCQRGE